MQILCKMPRFDYFSLSNRKNNHGIVLPATKNGGWATFQKKLLKNFY